MRSILVLFCAIALSVVAVTLLLLLVHAIPVARDFMHVWTFFVIFCGVALGIVGLSCIISWRVRAWLVRRKLGLKTFGAIALVSAIALSLTVAQTQLFEHASVPIVAASSLALGLVIKWLAIPARTRRSAVQSRSQVSRRSRRRVIIVVFDELDQRLLFEARSAGLALPTIDRFFNEALALENAVPPNRCTEISIPALLLGKIVLEAMPKGPSDLAIQMTVDGPFSSLSDYSTLFHDAYGRGYNVGCNVGYHPIEGLFPGIFRKVSCQEVPDMELGVDGSFPRSVCLQIRSILETPSFSLFADTLYARHAVSRYQRSLASSLAIIEDPCIDVAFLHIPVPHPPFIFDPQTRSVTARGARRRSYDDNLALVDQTLNALLDSAETTETAKETVVILTSDHWWRRSKVKDIRVPFAVWFSRSRRGIRYSRHRNTILLRDLTGALLEGKLECEEDVCAWVDRNGIDCLPGKV